MKSTQRMFALLLSICILLSVSTLTAQASPDTSSPSVIPIKDFLAVTTARSAIWKELNQGKAASATVAITDNGQTVYAEGFGMANREKAIPVDKNTLFNIGSVSKVYCTAAVMVLVDEGKIDLDKPVYTYLPQFSMADPRYKDITVRMLLSHSSGLPGSHYGNSFTYSPYDGYKAALLSSLAYSHLKHTPGAMAIYCNDGFTLAEILVETVSGKSFPQFLKEKIFTPLALNATGVNVGLRQTEPGFTAAAYYQPSGDKEPFETVALLGSGGLSTTAEELCRFAEQFSSETNTLLSPASLSEMQKGQPSQMQAKYPDTYLSVGLGWDVTDLSPYAGKGIAVLGKSGGTGHYSTMVFTLPAYHISVSVIFTGPGANAWGIADQVLHAYLTDKGILEKAAPALSLPGKSQPIPSHLSKYAGYYLATGGSLMKLTFDYPSNSLVMSKVTGKEESLQASIPYSQGAFRQADGTAYTFTTIENAMYIISEHNGLKTVSLSKIPPLPVAEQQALSIPIDGTKWLRRNVVPSESAMLHDSHMLTAHLYPKLPGYADFGGLKKIVQPNFAGLLPGMTRDLTELTLYKQGGQTWARVTDMIFSPETCAAKLEPGINMASICQEGYNQWYTLPSDAILHFTVPDGARVIVFSGHGQVTYDSALHTGGTVAPAGSFIEIVGHPGDCISITAKI